jgi:hypothetical protein
MWTASASKNAACSASGNPIGADGRRQGGGVLSNAYPLVSARFYDSELPGKPFHRCKKFILRQRRASVREQLYFCRTALTGWLDEGPEPKHHLHAAGALCSPAMLRLLWG